MQKSLTKFTLLAVLMGCITARLGVFMACPDPNHTQVTLSNVENTWYTITMDKGNTNQLCKFNRLNLDESSMILEYTLSYTKWFFQKLDYGKMRCNTENGQCYINWYYWLNPNMHGTVNFIIMNYSAGSYVVSYQCNSIWWLLWTSVWEEFEIWAPSTVMSDSTNENLRTWISNNYNSYDEKNTLIDATQGNICY